MRFSYSFSFYVCLYSIKRFEKKSHLTITQFNSIHISSTHGFGEVFRQKQNEKKKRTEQTSLRNLESMNEQYVNVSEINFEDRNCVNVVAKTND